VFGHAWNETAACGRLYAQEPLPLAPLHHVLDEAVECWPARPAIEFMGKMISYRELGALVDHAAKGLQLLDVGPGVRVALHLPTTPHVAVAFFAVLKAGGTLVDCSALAGDSELRRALDATGSEILITLAAPGWYEPVRRPLHATRLKTVVVGTLAQFGARRDEISATQRRNGEQIDVPVDGRHVLFGQLLRNDGRHRVHTIEPLEEAIALLRCTGAGARCDALTHATLSATCRQRSDAIRRAERELAGSNASTQAALPLSDPRTRIADMLLCVQLGALQLLADHDDRLVLNRMVTLQNCRSN
jgi:long-chain acyl-CoA synthetase